MRGTQSTSAQSRWRTVARSIGEVLVTGGLVVLLFVVYELFVTDVLTDRRQDQLKDELRQGWTAEAEVPPVPRVSILGDAFAVLHIPRLGADYEQVVLEGHRRGAAGAGAGSLRGDGVAGRAGQRGARGSPGRQRVAVP